MRAVSLWQPWASLVAIGAKEIETRGWRVPRTILGLRIAIHASKTRRALGVIELEPFGSTLRRAKEVGRLVTVDGWLPFGAIVATAVVSGCTEMTTEFVGDLVARRPFEAAFGDYRAGRFAWHLSEVEPLGRPVPWRGSQGVFEVPDDLLVAA
jgi:hypothetical protein